MSIKRHAELLRIALEKADNEVREIIFAVEEAEAASKGEIRDALALWRLHVAALKRWPGGIETEVCQGPLGAVISISYPGSKEDEEYLVEAGGDSLAEAVADATKELEP